MATVHAYVVIDPREPLPENQVLEVIQVKHAYCERDWSCGHRNHAEPGDIPGDADWGVVRSEHRWVGPRLVINVALRGGIAAPVAPTSPNVSRRLSRPRARRGHH